MLTTSLKQLTVCVTLSLGLVACGGGSGSDPAPTPTPTPTPTPVNNAPVITSLSAAQSSESALEVSFSWQVTDADNDDISCELNPGGQLASIAVDDCLATTTTTVTYSTAGTYTASLAVTDSNNASTDKALEVSVIDNSPEPTPELPEPVVTAGENELVIFYNRPDGNYTGWGLHLWADDTCSAYDGPLVEWSAPQAKAGDDPNYGAYWVVDLKADYATTDCVNYIMHKGDNKAPNNDDQKADLSGNRMVWLLDGISTIYTEPTLFPSGVQIADTAAHWTTLETVFWQLDDSVAKVRVYSADSDDLGYNGETGIAGDNFIEFAPATNAANALGMPRYSGLDMFEASAADMAKAKTMLKGKLLAIAYDGDDTVLAATYLQTGRVLDDLYTAGDADADEATLGLVYADDGITANVWAPTAKNVALKIFNASKVLQSTETMTLNEETGVWSFTTPLTNDRAFYQYELTLYHYTNQKFQTLVSSDPYSVSLSENGVYSQFVNLADEDLKPTDWDSHTIPEIADFEDAIIYEGNIRDFSIRDESTTQANRGKYLAFTEQDSAPVMHLKSLVAAGLTHFQILPANDIASVNENFSEQINLTSTVDELCAVNAKAPVCGVENGSATLLSVFQSYDPSTTDAKLLTQVIEGLDGYNFGYDPKHFNAPDGNFATNADGVSRILEMRSMNKALHDMGLRTSLDVVYNHTNTSGLYNNSVLDLVVPGYYYRRDLTTGGVMNATCCHDTETEHRMMDKLMLDSLVMWASEYKFDAFRFDIMGSHSKTSILNALAAVKAVDADTYFYGEGWSRPMEGYEQAGQYEMAGTEIGTFNDRPRDTMLSASLFNESASLNDQDIMRLGLSGTLADYQLQNKSGEIESGKNFSQPSYAKDPADIINYVSKHDGATLWDKLQYGLATDMSVDDRVRAQNITISMPVMSQGIPFLQIGGDLIRSKSMDRNSYNNGDWYNLVDFTKTTNNWNVGLPVEFQNDNNPDAINEVIAIINNPETTVNASHISFAAEVFNEFVSIRSSSKLFSLATAQDVYDRVGFHNTGTKQTKGLIVMSLDDGIGLTDLDANNDAIVVVINGSGEAQSHTVATASGFELHSVQQNSVDTRVQDASFTQGTDEGTFTVPALTIAVFVKPQLAEQGSGLDAGVTRDAPDVAPYGNTDIYLNASNDFDDANKFSYAGNDIYKLDTVLAAGEQSFTISSEDGTQVNLGFDDVTIGGNSVEVTNDNGSFVINVEAEGSFTFTLDASSEVPVLTISSVSLTVNCSALADSTDAIPFDIAGDGELYVKGDHSGWSAAEAYRLHYKGNNIYQAVAEFDGAMQFKLASSDGSWSTQLWAQAADSADINDSNLALGVTYAVSYEDAGTANNKTTLAAGSYSFLLTLNEANPSKGSDVGTMIIQQCSE
ncbi:alpha-1,6-glucosidase domain-containing protein [Colwelliaceae bacterium MEBiC 14330]